MKWDGQAHAATVKQRLYDLISKKDIAKASKMSNIDYASYLRNWYRNAGNYGGDKPDIQGIPTGFEITFKNMLLNNAGDKALTLSWSMAARQIRAWEYEASETDKTEVVTGYEKSPSLSKQKWDDTHLCGDIHGEHCEFLLPTSKDTVYNGKKLDEYSAYCIRNGKCRKLGHQSTWTGLTPTNCRKRLELSHERMKEQREAKRTEEVEKVIKKTEDIEMSAPQFNFDAFISQNNQLKQIPLDMLVPYRNHMFKLYDGERLDDMVQSIKDNGVLTPIIVRALSGGEKYEILAGHNRCNAAQLAGLTTVPGIVKENVTDEEAEMYVIETNLMQRGFEDLRITERAAVLAARHSAMFTEDKRAAIVRELAELNGEEVPEAPEADIKKSKLEQVGESYGLGKDSVARLIRVDKLIDELKPFVDDGKIALRAAVNLSYLFHSEQLKVADMLAESDYTVDMKKSSMLREVSAAKQLNDLMIEAIMRGQYNPTATIKPKAVKVKISAEISQKYFASDWNEAKIQEIVGLALEKYFNDKSFDDDDFCDDFNEFN